MLGDPWEAANRIGLEVHSAEDLPFDVGSRPGHVIYRWDPSLRVRGRRVWIGIAQCILTAAGVDWSSELTHRLVDEMLAPVVMQKVV